MGRNGRLAWVSFLPEPPLSQPVKIAIAGANGRMGQAVAKTLEGRSDAAVAARFERPGVEGGDLVSREEALTTAEAVIDFTLPGSLRALAEEAAFFAKGGRPWSSARPASRTSSWPASTPPRPRSPSSARATTRWASTC
jgi:hypothetical protein